MLHACVRPFVGTDLLPGCFTEPMALSSVASSRRSRRGSGYRARSTPHAVLASPPPVLDRDPATFSDLAQPPAAATAAGGVWGTFAWSPAKPRREEAVLLSSTMLGNMGGGRGPGSGGGASVGAVGTLISDLGDLQAGDGRWQNIQVRVASRVCTRAETRAEHVVVDADAGVVLASRMQCGKRWARLYKL